MKKIFSTIVIGVAALAMNAAEPAVVVAEADSVIVTEDIHGTYVTVVRDTVATVHSISYSPNARVTTRRSPGLVSLSLGSRDCGSRVTHSIFASDIYFGFVGGPGSPLHFEPGKSFEVGILNLLAYGVGIRGTGSYFSIGMGFNFRTYRSTTSDVMMVADEKANAVSYQPWPEDAVPRLTRIATGSLQFPLTWTQRLTRGRYPIKLTAGTILNWNIKGTALSSWRTGDNDTTVKRSSKGIGLRKFTADIYGKLSFGLVIGIYFRYSPMTVLEGASPRFYSFSTGISLIL